MADYSYITARRSESVGPFSLELECLRDLDETIDGLFAWLQAQGKEEELDRLCPYFGVVWPSARALGEMVAAIPDADLRGKSVLELGCGLAIPSLIAAKRGAHVVATDFHLEVPRFLARNRELNGVIDLEYQALNWQKGWPDDRRFDWVIGSDILYDRHQPEALASALEHLLAPGGTALIADPARPYLGEFTRKINSLGFREKLEVRSVPDSFGSSASRKEVFTLTLRKV